MSKNGNVKKVKPQKVKPPKKSLFELFGIDPDKAAARENYRRSHSHSHANTNGG